MEFELLDAVNVTISRDERGLVLDASAPFTCTQKAHFIECRAPQGGRTACAYVLPGQAVARITVGGAASVTVARSGIAALESNVFLEGSGAGAVTFEGGTTLDHLSVSASGCATVNLAGSTVGDLQFSVSGSARVCGVHATASVVGQTLGCGRMEYTKAEGCTTELTSASRSASRSVSVNHSTTFTTTSTTSTTTTSSFNSSQVPPPAPCYEVPDADPHEKVYDKEERLSKQCVVCYVREPCTVVLPCFHAVMCVHCSRLRLKDCPICRGQIQGIKRIFS
eukprot:Hpha_TRINITY_DN16099_c2_g12::TRINITY_DN16099_c2_g12_i1::g.119005::m.119005